MKTFLSALLLAPLALFAGCESMGTGTSDHEVQKLPEVRYYMIADT